MCRHSLFAQATGTVADCRQSSHSWTVPSSRPVLLNRRVVLEKKHVDQMAVFVECLVRNGQFHDRCIDIELYNNQIIDTERRNDTRQGISGVAHLGTDRHVDPVVGAHPFHRHLVVDIIGILLFDFKGINQICERCSSCTWRDCSCRCESRDWRPCREKWSDWSVSVDDTSSKSHGPCIPCSGAFPLTVGTDTSPG
jgi:hypothetical protein